MKSIVLIAVLSFISLKGFSQKQIISYEDMKYLVENNLAKADTFLMAKGYAIDKSSKKTNHKYSIKMQGGTNSNIDLRADGKRIFVEIQTDEISQYNMIYNSISQFLIADGGNADVKTFNVKELGTIYILTSDKVPYSPIRKDYDIHLVADKLITSYN